MVTRLSTRLERLEASNPYREKVQLTFALLEHPFPAGDELEWAQGVLQSFDHPGDLIVDVIEGPERKVLLPPTDSDAIAFYSPEERIIQTHHYICPRFQIIGAPELFILKREDTSGNKTRWMSDGSELGE